LGLLGGLFWPVLIVVGIVWLVRRSQTSPVVDTRPTDSGFVPASNQANEADLRYKIAAEIRTQSSQYKNQAQQKVVEDMAQTVEYFGAHSYYETSANTAQPQKEQSDESEYEQVAIPARLAVSLPAVSQPYETPWKKLQLLDGATILLYLGAFFVLASIGLYVGLGQGSSLKALLVTLITIGFYVGGISLYKNSKRLKPAGLTFVAIGMATLPMAGAAFYYFAFDKQNGPMVWLATSILAIALYTHAMYVLRSTLVSYMVVFSTLSVVLSSISSLGVAPYYYIQGIGFAGLVFALISRLFNKTSADLESAYDRSAMFLVPFSVGTAVLFAGQIGWAQLTFSLTLGALYYSYAALNSTLTRQWYVLLSQLMGIAAFMVGGYALTHDAKNIALSSLLVSLVYVCLWLAWASKLDLSIAYRAHIKYLLIGLPYVSLLALISSTDILWISVLAIILTSTIVYLIDRDWTSGISWLFSALALPLVVSYFAISVSPSASSIGMQFLAVGSLALAINALIRNKSNPTDKVLLSLLLYVSQIFAICFQIQSSNPVQAVAYAFQLTILSIWALMELQKKYWLYVPTFAQIVWLLLLADDARYLLAGLVGVIVYNLVLAQIKFTTVLHDWLSASSLFLVPILYGLAVSSPSWGPIHYWYSYSSIFLVLLSLRYLRKFVNQYTSTTFYLTALGCLYIIGYFVSPWFGFAVSLFSVGALLASEKLESSSSLGYIACLLPLGLLFHAQRSAHLALIALAVTTFMLAVFTTWRRRRYEAYLAIAGIVTSIWFAGTLVYDWTSTTMMIVYLALTAILIATRYFIRHHKSNFSDVLITGYAASLGLAFIYSCAATWQPMSGGLFVIGLLLTAISYIENSPWVIVGSFVAGYGSILRFADGNEFSLNATVGLIIFLSQSVYWVLILSKLSTVRAQYSRVFQVSVAALVPIIGLGFIERPIFPASLTLFGLILARELWRNGQNARELAIFMVHLSGLWWLYALGVREAQVFTQLTALLLGSFAYWRRRLQDPPALINQYLWAGVLMFSLPMVYQALSSGSSAYSYLLLVEHVVLIVVSIALKRATFAWWGIAVTVAAVLYQLRKLRYAALAFLGAFIISLAVYFLLKYNKPDQPE